MEILERTPHARGRTSVCPWAVAWEKNNLMEYGRYFCMERDIAKSCGWGLGVQAASLDSSVFLSMWIPSLNLTPARTRATSSGLLTFRHRS